MRIKMRICSWLLLLVAFPLWAQEATQEGDVEETESFIDATAAVWLSEITGNSSKAEEYGQLPDGFLINSFNVEVLMKEGRFLNLNGTNVGLNDAQYGFGYGLSGKYR